MTQFLIIQAPSIDISGFTSKPVRGIPYFERDAEEVFGTSRDVAVVTPPSGELDSTVDAAREAVIEGDSFANTRLGQLVSSLVASRTAFAFFWSDDCHDLPVFTEFSALVSALEEQLLTPMGNWELYARWNPTTSPPA